MKDPFTLYLFRFTAERQELILDNYKEYNYKNYTLVQSEYIRDYDDLYIKSYILLSCSNVIHNDGFNNFIMGYKNISDNHIEFNVVIRAKNLEIALIDLEKSLSISKALKIHEFKMEEYNLINNSNNYMEFFCQMEGK